MKRILVLFTIIPLLLSCKQRYYANDLKFQSKIDAFGIGILDVTSDSIPLYNSDNANIPFDTVKAKLRDTGVKAGTFEYQTTKLKGMFKPYSLNEGTSYTETERLKNQGIATSDHSLSFRVLKKRDSLFEVIISEKDKKTAIINFKKNNINIDYYFGLWEDYLKRVYGIAPNHKKPFPIFNKPEGNIIENSKRDSFKVISLKGYWAEVYYGRGESIGWIQWRDKDKLLVHVFYGYIE